MSAQTKVFYLVPTQNSPKSLLDFLVKVCGFTIESSDAKYLEAADSISFEITNDMFATVRKKINQNPPKGNLMIIYLKVGTQLPAPYTEVGQVA